MRYLGDNQEKIQPDTEMLNQTEEGENHTRRSYKAVRPSVPEARSLMDELYVKSEPVDPPLTETIFDNYASISPVIQDYQRMLDGEDINNNNDTTTRKTKTPKKRPHSGEVTERVLRSQKKGPVKYYAVKTCPSKDLPVSGKLKRKSRLPPYVNKNKLVVPLDYVGGDSRCALVLKLINVSEM